MQTNELENLTHPLITAEHLTRIAIVYVRQATREQTPDNNPGIARQRDQIQLARRYGWPEHLIEVIDEDTGKPVHLRTGWQRMMDQIAADRVGVVFAADISRLSRQLAAYEQFRMLASDHGTLLCIDNHIIDPRSS